ncbi:DUF6612 family protein [Gracilibacillus sp. HCP3S3_G5_1]|uniref:DUF6612 family protein n=1 Tax=unclassified Gracilibacillus TaxID=2625209 RepID=UPI003F8B929D
MKQKWWLTMLGVFFLTACSEENLSEREILEKTIEEMRDLENYSFTLQSELIDGLDEQMDLELEGSVIVEPFEASMKTDQQFFEEIEEMKTYYVEDTVYYDLSPELDYLLRAELSDSPKQLETGMEEFYTYFDQLTFSEDADAYYYQYTGVDLEENQELIQSLYPAFSKTSSFERQSVEFFLDNMDIVDFKVSLTIAKRSFLVKEINMEYVGEYNIIEFEDPPEISETITYSLFDHHDIEELDIPYDKTDDALTLMEHFTGEEANDHE